MNSESEVLHSETFQSHYRSDFNCFLSGLCRLFLYFNPIIGLILTLLELYHEDYNYFNPIIGLILTQLYHFLMQVNPQFQSHYRSDFNAKSL